MRFPQFLQKNGVIGFVAPSFGCNIEPYRSCFENAQRKFTELGYRLDLGPNCYEGSGIGISSTPEKCADELTEYYISDKNDCIISCGGGELMCETISLVDFDRIKNAAPKWYMGYSDNTNMTFLLATLCDTASIYGPCAAAFGMETWHPSIKDAYALLTGQLDTVKGYDGWESESVKSEENPFAAYNITEKRVLRTFLGYNETKASIKFSGRLLGGCMDCLVNLTGTRFDRTCDYIEKYKEDGFIWFLEACDLNVFSIRRAMWQMEEAGWFKYVKGFIIGRPMCFGQKIMGLDAYSAILAVAGGKNVPVVMDADLGHLPPMMPLIVGAYAEAQVGGNDISLKMECR